MCSSIHGATQSNHDPAVNGMLQTLTSKVKSKEEASKILSFKASLVKEIETSVLNKWNEETYNSEENRLRSLNVYFSRNVLGKRKYINMRKANNASSLKKSRLPNYIPYSGLSAL